MADDLFILQGFKPTGAQDYDALRRLGIERITALCGEIWSNHNSPDPGITMTPGIPCQVNRARKTRNRQILWTRTLHQAAFLAKTPVWCCCIRFCAPTSRGLV